MPKARKVPQKIGAIAAEKATGIGVLRYWVDIVQKPLEQEFKPIEDLFRGKSRLTRDPKIFEIQVVDKKMDTRLFGAINDRARAAARNGMMEALQEYVLPDTPVNPEYNYDETDLTDREDEDLYEFQEDYMPRAIQLYGETDYARYVAKSHAVYMVAPQIVDFNSYYELSAGMGNFLMRGHSGRSEDLRGYRDPNKHVYTINGRDTGPGVAGYRIRDDGTPYSGKNYRVYIYYGHDEVSAEYALKVHDDFSPESGGKFLFKNHAHIKRSVLAHITAAFKGVKKYSDFTEKIGASFSLAAAKSKKKK